MISDVPTTHLVRSFDGTSIAGHRFAGAEGPPLLLVNAIGPDISSWRCLVADVAGRRPLVTWDLRGLHGSSDPVSDRRDAAAHSEDAIAVLDDHGADSFDVVAWSTGTRIAIELARSHPDRVRTLTIVCGGLGRGLMGLLRHFEISSMFPAGAGIAKHFASTLQAPFRSFVTRPEIAGMVRQSGLIGPNADVDAVVEVLQSFARCDLRTLLATYQEVVGDDSAAVLTGVEAPTLLVAGARDRFTTPGMVDEMLRRLPNGERVVYERGSHFIPLEYSDRLASDVLAFGELGSRP